ncbi:MAG TPA: helix-turn-helix transcriptional regulator [Bacteroidales bacterium]|nr:helix-turn-helix transcriptional regulator [Bacteroidales bacterium]
MDKLKERIELLIATKGMTNAEFAESIGVQPSNISHIISGRNKPSLDLVKKVLDRFKEVRTEWLIDGIGAMTRDYTLFDEDVSPAQISMVRKPIEESETTVSRQAVPEISKPTEAKSAKEKREEVGNEEDNTPKQPLEQEQKHYTEKPLMEAPGKKTEKIVIFYNDKTFTVYSPEN